MIRAKFTCQQNIFNPENQTAEVIFMPVTPDPASEKNLVFWKYTRAGQITLQITNPVASAQFAAGTDYYVDFTAV